MTSDQSAWRMAPELWRALRRADDDAAARRHAFVGTEALAAALIGEPDTIAARSLARLGIDVDEVREALSGLMKPDGTRSAGDAVAGGGPVALSPRAARAIQAASPADRRGRSEIDTGDVLLALASDPGTVLAGVLASIGIDGERLRLEVQAVRSEPSERGGGSS